MMQKERATKLHSRKMRKLFQHADDDENGALSLAEFRDVMDDKAVRTWLSSMELEVADVDTLFSLLDDGDGRLTAEELVVGVMRLKGSARNLGLVTMIRDVGELKRTLSQLLQLFGVEPARDSRASLGRAGRFLAKELEVLPGGVSAAAEY